MSSEEESSTSEQEVVKQSVKRTKRGRPKVEKDEESEPIPSSPTRKRRRATPTRRAARLVETNEEEDSDFDPSEELAETKKTKTKKAAAKPKSKTKQKSFPCPHCDKVFTSEGGLKYHVDKYVCRMDECSDAEIKARAAASKNKGRKRGRSKSNASSTPQKKRFRGDLEQRTCPHCKRVFTSTLGMNYHLSRKVCQQLEKTSDFLFPTLQAGDRFVTMFGVVEVVRDDRGTSTVQATEIAKEKIRYYQSAKSKVEKQRSKMFVSKAIRLRVRRERINALFCNDNEKNVHRASTFKAYFGADPTATEEYKLLPAMPQLLLDPMTPPESSPDRIVECKWWIQEDENDDDTSTAFQRKKSQRLYLRRRLLTESFVPNDSNSISNTTQVCSDCGQRFGSAPGYKYHTSNQVCVQKTKKSAEARQAQEQIVELAANRILEGGRAPPEYSVGLAEDTDFAKRDGTTVRKKKKKKKKRKEFGMYPEVLLSLGFKVIKENMAFTENVLLPSIVPSKYDDAAEIAVQNDLKVDRPDALLDHLKQRLVERQRVSDDQKYGSMYTEVYKALGYKKPTQQQNKRLGSSRRRRAAVVKPPPPIIDISALADEIDSGRYPSKQRYTGDDHADICFICKDGGTLLCCDFCPNAVHMHCISEKFTIKSPEPDDDFMCHKCIQTVLHRRKRAEGRRLKKHEREEMERREEEKKNPDIKAGMEYEHLASKGQEFSELLELLQDARLRLRQSLATSKMNDLRRKLMLNG